MDEFVKSLPSENVQYVAVLQQTQGLSSPTPIEPILLTMIQLLTNSSTSEKASPLTIPPLSSSTKSYSRKETAGNRPSSTKLKLTSCLTRQTISGAQRLQIHQVRAFRVIIGL
jgi:hypothetical protein